MKNLTFEEMSLIAIYNDGSRDGTIASLEEMSEYLSEDEQELRALTDAAIEKLRAMTDEEFWDSDL